MREGARHRVDFTPYGRTLPAFEGLLDDAHFPALLSICTSQARIFPSR